jgi:hypothetical protein
MLALLALVGWVRSCTGVERITFQLGHRQHVLISMQGILAWFSYTTDDTGEREWSYNIRSNRATQVPAMEVFAVIARMNGADGEFPRYWLVHFRWPVLALTALSACLLLWKLPEKS